MAEVATRRLIGQTSIRLRITASAAAVTAVALALAGWLLVRAVEDSQLSEVRDRATASVDLAAERLADGRPWDDALTDLPSMVIITAEDGFCAAADPALGGVPLECSAGVDVLPGDERPSVSEGPIVANGPQVSERALTEDDRQDGVPGRVDGPGFDIAFGPASDVEVIAHDVETVGGTVEVAALVPVSEIERNVASVGRALWVLFPTLVVAVGLAAWWLTGRALRPVEAIRVEVDEIGGTSIHRRVPTPGTDDEIGRLADTMNAMLDRLERSARRQREFVSDASHELRSPIAAMRTDLEVALAEGDAADWSRVARDVLAEEARLETLVADLLVLAADEEAPAEDRVASVELRPVLADEVARSRRLPVELAESGATGDLIVSGTGPRLRQVFANLLDNAVRHATSRVMVTVTATADDVTIDVDDDGGGIPEADRARVFERFTRLDDGRARDDGGAGLGLAVVASTVHRFGGDASIDDSPLGGTRVRVRLYRVV